MIMHFVDGLRRICGGKGEGEVDSGVSEGGYKVGVLSFKRRPVRYETFTITCIILCVIRGRKAYVPDQSKRRRFGVLSVGLEL